MTAIKSDSNPDKRDRAKPDNYLENWIERQSLVESMIPIIGKFHRDKNVRILLYGNPLISLSNRNNASSQGCKRSRGK